MQWGLSYMIGGLISALFLAHSIGTFSGVIGGVIGMGVYQALLALNLDEFGRPTKDSSIFHD